MIQKIRATKRSIQLQEAIKDYRVVRALNVCLNGYSTSTQILDSFYLN